MSCTTEPFADVPNPSRSKSANHVVQSLLTQSAFTLQGEPFGERQLPFWNVPVVQLHVPSVRHPWKQVAGQQLP
jgi:hypothetical protein